jgi:protein TonB
MTSEAISHSANHLALDMVLPWHDHLEQQEKFKRIIKKVVAPIMAFLLVMSLLPDFTKEQTIIKKVVTKVILDPPKVTEIPQKPEPAKQKKTQSRVPKVKPKTKPGAASGVPNMATLSQQLSAMRNSVNVSKLQNKNTFVSTQGNVQKSSRALLGSKNANASSGGLKSSDITVNAKGASLASHKSANVSSPIMAIELPDEAQYHYDPSKNGKRDMQSIRRTLERYKGAVYALYAKALRVNPDIAGRFIFEFVILPNGNMDNLKIKSSELNNRVLEQKMINKIGKINFGKEALSATAVQYTFSFLPS